MAGPNSVGPSEEQGTLVLEDDVDIDVLSDYLHVLQQICRNGADDDAVMVVVKGLNLGKVAPDAVVGLRTEVGQKNGFLYSGAALPLQILHHIVSDFVAFYVIHYEKQHVSYRSFIGVDDIEYSMDSLVQ